MQKQILETEAIQLIKAGKAILTFRSRRTGKHFTYKVTKAKDKEDFFFCNVLTGPDNTNDYSYFGIINGMHFYQTKGSKISSEAISVKAFEYTFSQLLRGNSPEVDIMHEGRCCRCGRLLTTPESIERGIGPECWSKRGK